MLKKRIAVLALLAAGLLILTSCSINVGSLVEDILGQDQVNSPGDVVNPDDDDDQGPGDDYAGPGSPDGEGDGGDEGDTPGDDGDEGDTPGETPEDDDSSGNGGGVWTILIDDGFDAELVVPDAGISYLVNIQVGMMAEKQGGTSARGIYTGTIQVEMAIDEESFIAAINSLGGGEIITSMQSNIEIQTAEVTFSVDEYDLEAMTDANAQFTDDNGIHIIPPLTQPQGMVISSFSPQVTQTISLRGEEGSGFGSGGGGGEVPFLIEINSDDSAKLYLPRLLSMMSQNSFRGRLERP